MRAFFSTISKEPLGQFLLIALILLLGERLMNPEQYADDQYSIQIDDRVLAQYLQIRAKKFNGQQASATLEGLSAASRQRLIDDYVRSEVLYREAMALNLDRNDPIIRRRLMQKMEYLAQGFYDDIEPLTETELRRFYTDNQEDYRKAAEATFTHVFISMEKRTAAEAKYSAINLLKQLNAEQVPFENAPRFGQRFLYNRNYVNRQDSEIASHFGESFQRQLFALAVSENWQGPIQSTYGWHLVLLRKNTASYIPSFEAVSGILLADARRQQQQAVRRKAIDQLISQYQVTVSQ